MPVFVGLVHAPGDHHRGALREPVPAESLGLIAFALLCLGFFVKYVGWTIGLGGMVLSFLARDWRRCARGSPAPPAPPVPPWRRSTSPATTSR